MPDLVWFSLSLSRDMTADSVLAVLRPLANRPRRVLADPAIVVFESWSYAGQVSWRVGVDATLARTLPDQLTAQVPRLSTHALGKHERGWLTCATGLTVDGIASPLRTELAGAVSAGLLGALKRLQANEVGVVQWIVGPSRRRRTPPQPFDFGHALGLHERRKPDAGVMKLWADKTSEPLFACRGRVGAYAADTARARTIVYDLADSLKVANNARSGVRSTGANWIRADQLIRCTTSSIWSALLNAAELATLLGWPIDGSATDDLGLVGGHINPAPGRLLLRMDQAAQHSDRRVLGESMYAAQGGHLVAVPAATSLHHIHVVGPTGTGKSTLLSGLITADIAAGRSVFVLEPKGDLVQDVLAHVPAERRDDVVLIEPNSERPVGLNVLAGEHDQAEQRADQIVNLLAELHGGSIGPRSTDVALHALLTASRLQGGTMIDAMVLLTNPAFRRQALQQVSDPLVLGPWWAWFDGLSEAERAQVVMPLANKLRAFTARDGLRRMLGQAQPRFALEELFTQPRVVLVNLNKGSLGPETSSLLGSLILSQLWSAIQRRSRVPASERRPVMVVVDEVQDYLHLPGVDLGDFFAQARGLGVSVTVAHQHLAQLNPNQRAAILANARSRVVFRPAADDAKALAASFGSDVTGDDLLRLRAFEACAQLLVDNEPTRPFSVRTLPPPPWTRKPDALRQASRERYGTDGADVDQALLDRWQGAADPPDGPIGTRRRRSS